MEIIKIHLSEDEIGYEVKKNGEFLVHFTGLVKTNYSCTYIEEKKAINKLADLSVENTFERTRRWKEKKNAKRNK